ncbi:MAG: endonuclease/exonuclease/phosphatase family protein [Chthoniobacterales bacterium]
MLAPRAILAAALACLLVPHHGAAKPSDTVVFAAWNLRNYMLRPVKSEGGRITTPAKAAESIAAVVETLREIRPDILGLCEMGTRKDLADLQRRLKKAGLDLPHKTWVDGPDKERHLALLSRFPLEVQHDTRTTFRLGGLPQRVRRGILDVTARARPDFPLRILGVHLKSARVVPEYDQAAFRRAESLILRQRVESILTEAPDTPLLVFGDFNDTKNSPVVKGVAGRAGTRKSLTVLPLADRLGDQWTYRWDESDEYSRIDFVMVNQPLRRLVRRGGTRVHRDKDWFTASDHRPLVVTIALPDPPRP